MEDRRILIADTAIAVIADVGIRGLTHRAVDAAANLATGSTSYYARSKAQLVSLTVERLASLLRGYTEHTGLGSETPNDGGELVKTLRAWLEGLYADYQGELRARSALVLELQHHESEDADLLREALVSTEDLAGPVKSAGLDGDVAGPLLVALEGCLWEHSAGRQIGTTKTSTDVYLLESVLSGQHHSGGRGLFGLRR